MSHSATTRISSNNSSRTAYLRRRAHTEPPPPRQTKWWIVFVYHTDINAKDSGPASAAMYKLIFNDGEHAGT